MKFRDYTHRHVSERETAHKWPDGRWDIEGFEDCLWTSAVEVLRFGGLDIIAGLSEAEMLRAASGEPPLGPSNFGDLVIGAQKRYDLTLSYTTYAWYRLPQGTAGIVTGSLGSFPAGHPLRRFDPSYAGGHAVAVFRLDALDRVWWCDPLGPGIGYDGQWVSRADLERFARGLMPIAYGLFAPAIPDTSTEAPTMPSLVNAGAPFLADVAATKQLYKQDGTELTKASRDQVGKYALPVKVGSTDFVAIWPVTTGGVAQVVLVKPADVDNERPIDASAARLSKAKALAKQIAAL